MTPTTYDTQELRAVLQASADTAGDVSDFRLRLDQLLTEGSGDPATSIDEPSLVPLRRPAARWSSRRRAQLLTGAVLAACIAAIALALVLVPRHTSSPPVTLPTPDPQVSVPADLRDSIDPHSQPLRNFAGVGPRRLDLGDLPTVPDHSYVFYVSCPRGPFSLSSIGRTFCSPGPAGLGEPSAPPRHLRFGVGRGVPWHMLLVLQLDADTNAQLDRMAGPSPAAEARDYVLHEGRQRWSASGHGDATLAVPNVDGPGHLRAVDFACSGSGVHISTTDGQVDDDYTNDCWPGYVFQRLQPGLHAPTTLTVHADPSTRWVVSVGLN